MKNKLPEAIATLVGFIIGAGILGIPYAITRSGFVTGIVDIILIGIAMVIVNLYFGETVLRTKDDHQLTGYAKKYLGVFGKKLMTFCMIFGLYGGLIAYIIKEGEFLHTLFGPVLGGNAIIYSIIFFSIFTFIIYKGISAIQETELFMVFFIIIITLALLVLSFKSIDPANLTSFDLSKLYMPYGVILFAFLGIAAIPEVAQELRKNKKQAKKAIIIGSIIPIIIYLIFATIIVGVTGKNTTDGAVIGLGNAIGMVPLFLGISLGILTIATSYIAVGLALKQMYSLDLKMSNLKSTALVSVVPLTIFIVLASTSISNPFFRVLDITGTISGGLTGILVILMFWKAKELSERKPEYEIKHTKVIGYLLMMIFILGIIYELVYYIKF